MTARTHGRAEGFGAASLAARRVPIPIAPTLAARPPARLSLPPLPGGGSLPAAARRAPRGSAQDRRDVTQPRAVMRDHPTPPAALIGRAALVLRAGFSLRPSFRGVPPRAAPSAPPRGGCGSFGGSAAWSAALLFLGEAQKRENGAVSSPPASRGVGRLLGPAQRCPNPSGVPCRRSHLGSRSPPLPCGPQRSYIRGQRAAPRAAPLHVVGSRGLG